MNEEVQCIEEHKNGKFINFIYDKQSEEELKKILEKNIQITLSHMHYLNSINQLNEANIQNPYNINQLNNINNVKIDDCFLIDSDNFQKFREIIFYDMCQEILNMENGSEKDKKIDELIKKMKSKNNNYNLNNEIDIINDYQEYFNKTNSKSNITFMLVNQQFCRNINLNLSKKSNIFLFKNNNELYLFFKDKQHIMKIIKEGNYYRINSLNLANNNNKNLNDINKVSNKISNNVNSLNNNSNNINNNNNNGSNNINLNNFSIINNNNNNFDIKVNILSSS